MKKKKIQIKINFWDTAGQERFRSLTKSYFGGANGIIYVYDITNRKTFEGVKYWIKDSLQFGEFSSVLCGNKLDLKNEREVKLNDAKTFGDSKKMQVFETSAKDGTNLDAVFRKLVDEIMKNKSHAQLINEYGSRSNHTVTLTKINNSKKKEGSGGGCCKS